MLPSQMVEVSTPNNNNNKKKTANSTHSLLVLVIWFTVCCNSNLSTYFSKSQLLFLEWMPNTPNGGYETHEHPAPHPVCSLQFSRACQLLLVSQHSGKLPFTTRGLKSSQHTYHLHYKYFKEM